MVHYECRKCKNIFDRKISLERHMARKNACSRELGSKTNKHHLNPKCKKCEKIFSRTDSLKRHLKVCKGIPKKKIKKEGYVYLVQERDFVNSKQDIYKIGKSIRPNLCKFKQNPKDTELLLHIRCHDCVKIENKIKKLFKKKYIQETHNEIEYFEGDPDEMKYDICKIIIKDKS